MIPLLKYFITYYDGNTYQVMYCEAVDFQEAMANCPVEIEYINSVIEVNLDFLKFRAMVDGREIDL